MEAKDDAMALRCGVCGHDHEQGVKCPICGHTGKSRSYKCFKMTFTAFDFTVQSFDSQGQDAAVAGTVAALERANLALWTFIKILRGRIFPNMAKALPDDPMARHLVAFVGDGPMGIARWRPASEESGSQVAIIEHFGVVESKRRQGYARRFLRAVVEVSAAVQEHGVEGCGESERGVVVVRFLQDIEAIYAQQPTRPQALVAYVPQTDSFAAMKLFQSVGFQPAAQVEVVEDSSFLRMRMAWGCNRS